jgi:hypothetical protein
MPVYEHREILETCDDGSWCVCVSDRRLVFLNGASAVEVPVEGPLRWCQDGVDMTFERALGTVPAELHGWMTLAAIIALRHCLAGVLTGVALPAGYHEWSRLAARAEPICAWMHALANLDGVDPPPLPGGIDDGLSSKDADGDTTSLAET